MSEAIREITGYEYREQDKRWDQDGRQAECGSNSLTGEWWWTLTEDYGVWVRAAEHQTFEQADAICRAWVEHGTLPEEAQGG
jgi:hypothetical protein